MKKDSGFRRLLGLWGGVQVEPQPSPSSNLRPPEFPEPIRVRNAKLMIALQTVVERLC